MVNPEHGGIPGQFDRGIEEALRSMGLQDTVKTFSNTTIEQPGGGIKKEADEAWGPVRPPRGYPRNKPTVVLEVGVSESSAKLRRDAQFWLNPEMGQANFVITCKLDRKMPIITIATWERTENRSIRRSQQVILSKKKKESEEISKSCDYLTIPFSHLFRREPEGQREKDIILGEERLGHIAKVSWITQGFWDKEES